VRGRIEEVKYLEDMGQIPTLTDEDHYVIQQKIQALDKILRDKQKAKYKIELLIVGPRSSRNLNLGMLSFWESGTKFHGGGDDKIYFCPGKKERVNNCYAVIPSAYNNLGVALCPSCGCTWKKASLIGEVPGRYPMQVWADLIYRYFRKLEHNCDIYLKHAPLSIRSVAKQEQERQKGGELLQGVRNRILHIYPLANIIVDTKHGSDITKRFYAFLVS
jgi:hypothetical protein